MILLIDNYDSFTYNLYQQISLLGKKVHIVRNDACTLEDIEALAPEAIVLSPGPGTPQDAGLCIDIVRRFYKRIPILGICLGHQAIAAAFGARIAPAMTVQHGKRSPMRHLAAGVFAGFASPLSVMRYHSLAVEQGSLPPGLHALAWAEDDGELLAMRCADYPVYGFQFHPESIGTEAGLAIMRRFFDGIRKEFSDETPIAEAGEPSGAH